MSRQQSSGFSSRASAGARRRLRHGLSVAVTVAVIVGLAACGGDDDDAADSTSASESSAVETTSAPDTTTAAEITAAHDTTGTEPSDTASDDTTTDGTTTDGTTDATSPDDSEPETAGPGGTASETTDGSDGATANAAAAASESSDADDASDGSAGDTTEGASDGSTADVGPTTTGPACEFEENTSLPLERCDMGPAVAVVQSILQAGGFEVGIDGNFGDQTLYAVRAFQEAEGLKVDGIVGVQTWSELGIDEQFGTDANGDGVIAPDELDLTE